MAHYNVSSNLIYTWCKQARLGLIAPMKQGAFAPVAIVEPAMTPLSGPVTLLFRCGEFVVRPPLLREPVG
jgi:hypothetical protein